MSFKSGQEKRKKKYKEGKLFLKKKKKSRPHLASKTSLLIYLTVGLNLKTQISNKIIFLCISFWAANEDKK